MASGALTKELKLAVSLSMKQYGLAIFLFGCILIVIAGCGEKPVAVVNGDRITEKEFVDKLKEMAGERILQQMIDRQIVEDAFQKAGLVLSEEDIAASIQEMQSRAPSPAAFEEYLVAHEVTIEDLREGLSLRVKIEKLATKDIAATDEQLKQYYERNKHEYDKPLRVKISEIVTLGKQQAEQALAALGEEGVSFADVAGQFSVSPATRTYGGQRALAAVDDIFPPELREAVSSAEEGDIVGPIETERGWYVLRIDQRLPAEKSTFESHEAQVIEDFKLSQVVGVPRVLARDDPRVLAALEGKVLKEVRPQAVVKIVAPEYSEMGKLYAGPPELPEFGGQQSPPVITPETAQPTPPPAEQSE